MAASLSLMTQRHFCLFFVFCMVSLNSACGLQLASSPLPANPVTQKASVQTVDIPLTPVENQGRFGICWAYGTIGLIESSYKSRTGQEINLSEEALAFYRLTELITATIQSSKGVPELLDNIRYGYNEGFFSRILPAKKKAGELDALDLVKKYGVVPESAWNVKIIDAAQRDQLLSDLRHKTLTFISGRELSTITAEEVMSNIVVGSGPFHSEPPRTFTWENRLVSPQEFLTKVVGFEPDDFAAVEVQAPEELDLFVTLVKRALAAGYSVPFGFPINVDRISGGNFSGSGVDQDNPQDFVRDGGHLVLISDFVNEGGTEGAVSSADLEFELSRPAAELSYFKFKNSWGLGAKKDEQGREISNSPDGFFRIFRSYLTGASRAAAKGFLPMNAVVPKELLSRPLGP